MIEARRLYSLGMGLTDAHLIASVLQLPDALRTRDKQLRKMMRPRYPRQPRVKLP